MGEPGEAQGNDGFFELRQTPGKGRGAFALKDISAGTRIFVETAIFVIEKGPDSISLNDVQTALQNLDVLTRAKFNALPVPHYAQGQPKSERQFAVFSLHNHVIVGHGTGKSALGCFAHASRFNHSCLPNCAMSTGGGDKIQCFVFTNVRRGDELTFTYSEEVQYMTTNQRQKYLQNEWDGPCLCALCTAPAAEREISDIRRQLMRHLLCILEGEELADNPQTMFQQLEARRRTPIERRDDCCQLWHLEAFAFLAEAEGVTAGSRLRRCYQNAIQAVILHCSQRKISRIDAETVANLRRWARRARELKANLGANNYGGPREQDFMEACRIIDAIDDGGNLPLVSIQWT